MLSSIVDYLDAKTPRYQLIPSSYINNQKILKADRARGTTTESYRKLLCTIFRVKKDTTMNQIFWEKPRNPILEEFLSFSPKSGFFSKIRLCQFLTLKMLQVHIKSNIFMYFYLHILYIFIYSCKIFKKFTITGHLFLKYI